VRLNRPDRAVTALTKALEHATGPRRPAILLANLGDVLAQDKRPEEACLHLTDAFKACQAQEYTAGYQFVFGVRDRFPKELIGLACVRELDELLRRG
jgi:hypothetical protein